MSPLPATTTTCAPVQHPLRTSGRARSFGWEGAAHVRLRADGLRLRPYRQLQNVSRDRCSAAVPEADRNAAAPRHEHHRRGRQDHSQLRRRRASRSASTRRSTWMRSSRIWTRCAWSGRRSIARATENIDRMVELIEKLAEAGAAYKTDDGSWYFRLRAFPEYGKLSKKDLSGMEDGARVDVDEYEKDSARDFALWKAAETGRDFVGYGDRARPAGMAHRVLGDVDEVPGRQLRSACRRRRPDVSAPRERDCAERERDAQATGASLDARAVSAGGRQARCRRAKGTSIRCAICC